MIRLQGLYNIAPGQNVPVVRLNGEEEWAVGVAQWGLIPSWSKSLPRIRPTNARAETVESSAMYRQAFERRRRLVPADGFYEWQGSKPPKQPYFIHQSDDALFAFAGLWERWRPGKDQEPIDTVTIITTTPNVVMSPIHQRMPVILDQADYDRWLARKVGGKDVADLLKPFAGELMANPVSTKVNNVHNDGPELIKWLE